MSRSWAYLAGLSVAGAIASLVPGSPYIESVDDIETMRVVVAGVLVGFGTRMGNGCTSGHGINGLPRFSPRSLVAVMAFISFGCLSA